MFRLRYVFLVAFVFLISAACSPQEAADVAPESPVFILFYTEN
ncbi:MAG: hypothetical protein Kow0080_01910 [Candidatus Promineifilaceae bacterium]